LDILRAVIYTIKENVLSTLLWHWQL